MKRIALILIMLTLPFMLGASLVPANIDNVQTGGYWSGNGDDGQYRVVVVNSGFEHVVSHVYVEWIETPKDSDTEPTVIASVEPNLPFGNGIASLETRLIPIRKNRVSIVVSGTDLALSHVKATLIATTPGKVYARKK